MIVRGDRRAAWGWLFCGIAAIGALAFSWTIGLLASSAIALAGVLTLSRRIRTPWPLLLGISVACWATLLVLDGRDPMLAAEVALYDRTGIAAGRLAHVRAAYIDVRITRMENCERYEDSTAGDMAELKAGCIKSFVGAVDRSGLAAARKARADGDMAAAILALERIYHEPVFRTAAPAAYPDFLTWWKGDAGLRCDDDMDKGPAVAVLVYCLGSRPDAARAFCAAQAFEPGRAGEPMLAALCDPPPGERFDRLARDAFAYCFAGICRYPDARRGAFGSVDPLI